MQTTDPRKNDGRALTHRQGRVVILLGSSSDMPVTEDGTVLLRRHGVPFSLRICSAHRTPEKLHEILRAAEADPAGDALVYICVAGMSAHLAGVVASLTLKPVLAVPVYRPETAGFDALMSMSQMPKGIPVGTMGFGKHGFINACLQAAQMFALSDPRLALGLAEERAAMAQQVDEDDARHRQDFGG